MVTKMQQGVSQSGEQRHTAACPTATNHWSHLHSPDHKLPNELFLSRPNMASDHGVGLTLIQVMADRFFSS